MSAMFLISKLVSENSVFRSCRSELRSNHFLIYIADGLDLQATLWQKVANARYFVPNSGIVIV